ncbi:hypothetical protein DPMN_181063 [Dreissena polymorpha]|uniref:Uncharacterized protein n=1 Tax=Dreissena polymorpha TaxID=45954 RepID=A0A9D4DDI0_DREPO|nr:hypothetical protein DPMN_181063 [Dreissena polymorpha]
MSAGGLAGGRNKLVRAVFHSYRVAADQAVRLRRLGWSNTGRLWATKFEKHLNENLKKQIDKLKTELNTEKVVNREALSTEKYGNREAVNELEQFTRINNIVFHGLQDTDKNETPETTMKLVADAVKQHTDVFNSVRLKKRDTVESVWSRGGRIFNKGRDGSMNMVLYSQYDEWDQHCALKTTVVIQKLKLKTKDTDNLGSTLC